MSSQAAPGQCDPEKNPNLDTFLNTLIGQAYELREKRREVELLRKLKQEKTSADHETEEND